MSLPFSTIQDETRKDLIVATAGSGCLASLVTGLFANFPVGLAPGMGLNAYFTYNVVGYMGKGNVRPGLHAAGLAIRLYR